MFFFKYIFIFFFRLISTRCSRVRRLDLGVFLTLSSHSHLCWKWCCFDSNCSKLDQKTKATINGIVKKVFWALATLAIPKKGHNRVKTATKTLATRCIIKMSPRGKNWLEIKNPSAFGKVTEQVRELLCWIHLRISGLILFQGGDKVYRVVQVTLCRKDSYGDGPQCLCTTGSKWSENVVELSKDVGAQA